MDAILDQIRENPNAINEELLAALSQTASNALKDAKTAFALYHEDIKARCNRLILQGKEYAQQIAGMQTKRTSMANQINYLSSRGDIEAAAEVEVQIEALDREIAAIERKERIISAADVKGDPQLYCAAKEALDKYIQEAEICREYLAQVKALAKAEQSRLNKLIAAADNAMHYHYMTSEFEMKKAFDKVEQNFQGR